MIDPKAYSITIRKGIFEGEECYEARVRELPDLVEYADTFEEAYELALDGIETTAEIFAEQGRDMPSLAELEEEFSGRVTLRLPKSLHRSLAVKAAEEGVSLNQLLVSVLSMFRGFATALEDDREKWSALIDSPEQRLRSKEKKVVQLRDYRSVSGW